MSLVKPIPPKLREEMSADKWYKKCCIADNECSGKIEWHHNLIFKSERQNIKEAILPICQAHHRRADTREIREKLDWVMLQRMDNEQLEYYSKAMNYKQYKIYLEGIYGKLLKVNLNQKHGNKKGN